MNIFRVYRRSISAQDPLCMSTPRSNKSKLQRQVSAASRRSNYGPGGNGGMPRSSNSSTISITTDKTDDYQTRARNAVERRRSRLEASKPERNHRVDYRSHGTSTAAAAAESTNRSTGSTSADRGSIGVNTVNTNNNSTIDSSGCSNFEQSVDCISVVSVEQSVRSVQSARSNGGATTAAASIVTADAASVRSIELRPKSARSSEFESKRGTLTSLSSGSTSASPPSTTTSR